MTYATVSDLELYLTPVPDNAEVLLDRASVLVRQATLTAVYAVDDAGMPVDEQVADAFRRAVCEQVAAWAASGEDGTGVAAQYASVSIGSVSLSRAAGLGGGGPAAGATLAPQAWMILYQAGLVTRGPWVG